MKRLLLSTLLLCSMACMAQNFYLFIGTYTVSGSKGIYVYTFNTQTGKAKWISNTDTVINPSYLTVSVTGDFVYAVNETNGTNPGRISAFSFNKNNGTLTLLNSRFSGGDDPCYVEISKDGKWVAAANYTGGSVSVFPLNKNGSLQPCSQLVLNSGKSINTERQEKSHVHESVFSPDNDYLLTPDLGTDKVMIYKFNPLQKQPLEPASLPFINTSPGSGPRHLAFHPNKKFVYLVHELNGNVAAYSYHKGKPAKLQEVPTHPPGFKGIVDGAEIYVSPDGKFLYTSNREDENTIAVFSINLATGKLQLRGYQSAMGRTPRNFIIDPTGNYLLVANQDTDNIIIFKRNARTGLLTATGEVIHVPKPVCLQMIKIKK